MSVAFEEAINTLAVMFSSWDRETLATVLEANSGHMEQTIDALLMMDNGQEEEKKPQHSTKTPTTKVQLPDDFLRVPGGENCMTDQEKCDEILALMLQDEIFQKELAQEQRLKARRDSLPSSSSAGEALSAFSTKISSMSDAMKSKMYEMYNKYQNKDLSAPSHDSYSEVPLMSQNDEDDEEEEALSYEDIRKRKYTSSGKSRPSLNPSSLSTSRLVSHKKDL